MVVASLLPVMASLTECKLRSNNLGIKGWTEIFNALRNSPTSKITTWDLSYENLGPDIAKPLAEYLSVTASANVGKLKSSPWTQPLCAWHSLSTLISHCSPYCVSALVWCIQIDLSYNRIDAEGAKPLADALRVTA